MERVAVVTGAARGFGREIARRLAARGYSVLASDVDEAGARRTAEEIGGNAWSLCLDVRDPAQHRAAAEAAAERGRLEVWVNNAGVLRTGKAWGHGDGDVRLMAEVNFLGVVWGTRAAVDAMRAQNGSGGRHIVNLASLSAFGPIPGLAVYGATKHAVLGFTSSVQGDLDQAGIAVRMHAVCPDGADTGLVREREDEPEAAILWSGGRLLDPGEVADRVVGVLDGKRLVLTFPRYRGVVARAAGMAPRAGLKLAGPLTRLGERVRRRQ